MKNGNESWDVLGDSRKRYRGPWAEIGKYWPGKEPIRLQDSLPCPLKKKNQLLKKNNSTDKFKRSTLLTLLLLAERRMLLTSLSSVKCWDFFLCPTFETKSVNKSYFRCDSAWVTYYVFYLILRNVSFTTKWNKSHFTSAKIYRIKCIFSLWTSIIDNIRLPTFLNCSWYKLLVRIKLIEIWTKNLQERWKSSWGAAFWICHIFKRGIW